MENKLGGDSTKQIAMQVCSGSINNDSRPSEVSASGNVGSISNYSIQTGEEFALEFMLERANHKKISGLSASGDQNSCNTMITKGTTENLHSSSLLASTLPKEVFSIVDDGSHRKPANVAVDDGSGRETSHGLGCLVSPGASAKVKLFCSFGGKILPRPSDGNLRYVGGDTHIIRVSKNISWWEMLQRMSAIYNRTNTIKYQLPGEDLDSLVTVCSDQDLENMMEECSVIEECDSSQKLRMFLFPSTKDAYDLHFCMSNMQGDSEVQYIAAVNGMDLVSVRSPDIPVSANDMDLFLNHNKENCQVTTNMDAISEMDAAKSNDASFLVALTPADTISHILPLEINSHTQINSYLISHNGHNEDVESDNRSHIAGCTNNHYENMNSRELHRENISAGFQCDVSDYDTKVPIKQTSRNSGSTQQKDDFSPTASLENGSFSASQQHTDTAKLEEDSCGKSASENMTLIPLKIITKPDKNSSAHDADNTCLYKLNGDGQPHTSSEAFSCGFSNFMSSTSGWSDGCPSSHSSRVYHSERIPREQAQIINRLSKSDDSISPHSLKVNSHLSQESTRETIAPFQHGGKHPTLSSRKSSPSTIEDGLKQMENYREFADSIIEKIHLGNTESEIPGDSKCCHVLDASECSIGQYKQKSSETTKQMPCNVQDHAESQTNDLGHIAGMPKKSDLDDSPLIFLNGKKTTIVEACLHEVPGNGPLKSDLPDIENGNIKERPKKTLNGDLEFVEQKISVTSIKTRDESRSDHHDATHEGKFNVMHSNNVIPNDTAACPDSSTLVLSLSESSDIVSESQKRDILTEINDRFPPGRLSDIFSICRNNVSNCHLKNQTTLSINMQNPEPRHWSYFRNLAQDQFGCNNVSLMDQDYVACPSSAVIAEEEKMGMDGEGMQVENPFLILGENLRMPASDCEEGKSGYEYTSGHLIDVSYDFDINNLQSIKNEDLEEIRELGSGTFGIVYHGTWRGTDVAIKRIKKSCLTGNSSEQDRLILEFWKEAEILSKLHHPNVLAFYGIVNDGPGNTLATVTEFMVNGSLRQVLPRKDRYLDLCKQFILAMDTAFGMEYLHSKNVVHFDLKCDNLLVNLSDPSRPICKVGDFGLSKIKRSTLVSGGVMGTLPWMAPELLTSSKVSEKVDVFSFGIVMWEILTGEEPYANMHYGAIIGGIINNTLRPPVPKSCDPDWKKLMEQCWVTDPMQRPSFSEIASQLRLMHSHQIKVKGPVRNDGI